MIYGNKKVVSVSPTITAGAYSAGDVVGGLMTFPVASAGGGGEILQVAIIDDDDEKAQCTLYIFDAAPTAIADNAAFASAILVADLKKLVAVIAVASADFASLNSNAWVIKGAIDRQYSAANLYMYCVCVATPTYTAVTDLTFKLTVSAD